MAIMHSLACLIQPLLLLLLLLLHLPSSSATLLEDTCRSITASRSDLTPDICISSLSTDPSSRSADLHGLALIATHLSIVNATSTAAKVQKLIDEGPEPKTSDCLSVCLDVYSDAADHLREASAGIESRNYPDAVTFLSAAVDAAENCEDAFGDENMNSPMAEDDRGFERMAKIALAIVSTLR
ncbi:putative invertase inhibitor [Dendrobium catenatum]|nr:putative invertase inhibitor [Dendrobium catenatum]